MYNKLYDQIEQSITNGVPPHLVSANLVKEGWPENMVNEALESWLLAHGKIKKSTAFKDWIKKYHRKALPAVVVVVILNVISVSINLLKPWPTKILADSAFGNLPAPEILEAFAGQELENTTTLILITSLMTLTLFILGTIFGTIRDFVLLKIGFWLNKSIKQESMRHIMHLPLFHQERLSKGDYVYRQNVVTNSLSDLVLGTTSSIIESIIVIVGVIAIMLTFDVKLTLISIVLIPFLFITMKIIGPHLGKVARELTELASETSSRINESVDNAETVQAFTLEDKLLTKITKLWDRGYELSKKSLLWGELLTGANGLLIVLATSLVMYLGGSAALRGEITLGELLIFMTYMGYLLSPVENLVEQITSRNQKIIDVNRIYEVLADHEGIEYLRNDIHMPTQITGQIEFQNVSYSYDDNIVFENLNLIVHPGQKAAIIGPSGGGKSTVLKLLPLYIEPDKGRVLIDNVDIQTVSLKELRQHISWVSQTPQLFDGTIIDNLTDGDAYREVSNEEIMNAIETANVTEFASKLPLGLASPAGENGGSLSGGQRQRVSIARALVKNAPIVCLDEPTAALDAKSENLIRDSLLQMIKGKTVMMVTHRKALLTLMDVVYVLDKGTLTDVNKLGGLDSYLARLEGIEEQKVVEEIKQDIAEELHNTPDLYQQYINDFGSPKPALQEPDLLNQLPLVEVNTLPINHDPAPYTPTNISETVKPWTPPLKESKPLEDKEPIQMPDDSSLETTPDSETEKNDNDVVIKLH
jgi:ABC-type multidrug transport system fused ATPase/permease subunit